MFPFAASASRNINVHATERHLCRCHVGVKYPLISLYYLMLRQGVDRIHNQAILVFKTHDLHHDWSVAYMKRPRHSIVRSAASVYT